MSTGTINISLRPIKLSFLIDPFDRKALFQAIQINSFLWGGLFNPIIPFYRRRPINWERPPAKKIKMLQIVEGYLNNFDPDYVVQLGQISKIDLNFTSRKIVKAEDILGRVDEDGTPAYGIGIFELLNHFFKKEIKFVRKYPLNIAFPNLNRAYRLFLASIFGQLPEPIDKKIRENFDDPIGISRPDCSINTYLEFLSQNNVSLRRLTTLELKPRRQSLYREGQCIFLMDASKNLDVIDYWNLRAVGWNVLPIGKQISSSANAINQSKDFIDESYFPSRGNPKIFHRATILKSRNVSEGELKNFTESLKIPKAEKPHHFKFVNQHWYPRMWDNWARDKDGVDCCTVESRSDQHDLQSISEYTRIKTLDPQMIKSFGGHSTARFVNEIDIRFYGDTGEPFAEIIPEGVGDIARSIGAFGIREWRVSKKGLVFFSRHTKWHINLKTPKSENVFLSWLKANNWSGELSPPGRIAKEMIKLIGGSWGSAILAKPRLIALLQKMSDGKPIKQKAFWGEIQRIANEDKFGADPSVLLKTFIDFNMFRLGLEVQCDICQQHSWYSLKDIDYTIKCPKCLNQIKAPAHSPDDLKWSYRTFGPFSLPRQAYGVYSVLLTLHFFARVLDGATTPIMSFNAKRGNKNIEADLGLFYQNTEFGKEKREIIFAECKTYNRFAKKDIDRLKILANAFPGSIIVFSTLNSSLTINEKKLIRPFVKKGRKYLKDDRSFNPVLILTATELFSDFGLEDSYKEKGGRHEKFAERSFDLMRLLPLCDITQQLYLDMISWHEWLDIEREKRLKKLKNV